MKLSSIKAVFKIFGGGFNEFRYLSYATKTVPVRRLLMTLFENDSGCRIQVEITETDFNNGDTLSFFSPFELLNRLVK